MLRIPTSQREAFSLLAKIESPEMDSLVDALKQPLKGSYSDLIGIMASSKTVDRIQARRILAMLSSLFSLLDDEQADASQLLDSLEAALEEDRWQLTAPQIGNVRSFLERVLNIDDLALLCKARTVSGEASHTLCYSRVLTDVRPVFKVGTSDAAAALIVHTLKIAVHGDNGEIKEVFVALSTADIVRLQAVLARAVAKEESLRRIHSRDGALPILEGD